MIYWVIPSEGHDVGQRSLTTEEIAELEAKGYERFVIGRGNRPSWVGYAEDARDVGRLRRIMLSNDERYFHPKG